MMSAYLHVDHAVRLQHVKQLLLPLPKQEAGVLRECAMDVAEDDVFYFLLPNRYLQQRVVPTARLAPLLQASIMSSLLHDWLAAAAAYSELVTIA